MLTGCGKPDTEAEAAALTKQLSAEESDALPKKTQELEGTVEINNAPIEKLMMLPRVGNVTANRIIEARPFSSPEDLLRVSGIGEKTLEGIRPFIEVSQSAAPPKPTVVAADDKVRLVSTESDSKDKKD